MSALTNLRLALHGCPEPHVPRYDDAETIERLARLRRGLMSSWESQLILGEGNWLTKCYAPMVVGMVDVVDEAARVVAGTGDLDRLRKAIAAYLRDIDTAKAMEQQELAQP